MGTSIGIEPHFQCDYGSNIHVGDSLFMNFGGAILDCNIVRIGANVQCGLYVQLYTA
jgi:maltose O-acetyltransferase